MQNISLYYFSSAIPADIPCNPSVLQVKELKENIWLNAKIKIKIKIFGRQQNKKSFFFFQFSCLEKWGSTYPSFYMIHPAGLSLGSSCFESTNNMKISDNG